MFLSFQVNKTPSSLPCPSMAVGQGVSMSQFLAQNSLPHPLLPAFSLVWTVETISELTSLPRISPAPPHSPLQREALWPDGAAGGGNFFNCKSHFVSTRSPLPVGQSPDLLAQHPEHRICLVSLTSSHSHAWLMPCKMLRRSPNTQWVPSQCLLSFHW